MGLKYFHYKILQHAWYYKVKGHYHYGVFWPSNVSSTLYKSGRRSRNTPQLCLLLLILSKLNSATSTASSLSLAAATISPVGPGHQNVCSKISLNEHPSAKDQLYKGSSNSQAGSKAV